MNIIKEEALIELNIRLKKSEKNMYMFGIFSAFLLYLGFDSNYLYTLIGFLLFMYVIESNSEIKGEKKGYLNGFSDGSESNN